MKKSVFSIIAFQIIVSLILIGCGGSSDTIDTTAIYSSVSATNSYSGSDPAVYHVDTNGSVNLSYTLNLGSSAKSVYFIFTNTSTASDSSSSPSVSNDIISSSVASEASSYTQSTVSTSDQLPVLTPKAISTFNRKPFGKIASYTSSLKSFSTSASSYAAGTSTNTFYYDSATSNTVPATCQGVYYNTDTLKTLNIWVADDCWTSGGTKTLLVTQEMVDALGEKFMSTSGTSTIYSWDTSIFGAPWGSHSYSNLISSSAASSIDILICDVNTLVGNNISSGVVVGFYYAKDNYKNGTFSSYSLNYSNERVMFYIDAISIASSSHSSSSSYGKTSSDTWSITESYWPAITLSTLAHEFQHMIHFYQKQVLLSANESDTWLNEMCSMAAEDLIADKLGISSPADSRIPYYNRYDYYSLIDWDDDNSLPNYGLSYAFGSYLARNYEGAQLFKKIVQNKYSDYQAVTQALSDLGYSETFPSLMQKWGAAVVLSNFTSSVPSYYQYNNGSTFSSTLDSTSYTCDSINLFSYSTTPTIATSSSGLTKAKKSSNQFYLAGSSLSGTKTYNIKMESGVKLTVVVK